MTGKQKFLYCRRCHNMVGLINDSGVPIICCGEKMLKLEPNTVEASTEKHLPVVNITGDSINVQIGSVPHPMEEEHHIVFVYVETERGGQRKSLKPGEEPKLSFAITDDKPVAVYAYCNLHGLWQTEIA